MFAQNLHVPSNYIHIRTDNLNFLLIILRVPLNHLNGCLALFYASAPAGLDQSTPPPPPLVIEGRFIIRRQSVVFESSLGVVAQLPSSLALIRLHLSLPANRLLG